MNEIFGCNTSVRPELSQPRRTMTGGVAWGRQSEAACGHVPLSGSMTPASGPEDPIVHHTVY